MKRAGKRFLSRRKLITFLILLVLAACVIGCDYIPLILPPSNFSTIYAKSTPERKASIRVECHLTEQGNPMFESHYEMPIGLAGDLERAVSGRERDVAGRSILLRAGDRGGIAI